MNMRAFTFNKETIPLATTESRDFSAFQYKSFFVTDKAHYTVMFNRISNIWVTWVTDANDNIEIEYSEHHRPGDAQARLARLYSQIERGLVH